MNGYGIVYEQSVSPNSIVDGSQEIEVKLHEINYVEPEIVSEDNQDAEKQE